MPQTQTKPDQLMVENAEVMWRNFQGREGDYNSAGDRNFCVFFEDDEADRLKRAGWNIKETKVKEEGDVPRKYLQVAVQYDKGRPPRVVLITNGGTKRVDLAADSVGILDSMDIKNWDLVITPYPWTVRDDSGIKAYLKMAFVTLDENQIEMKYAHLEDDRDPTVSSATANEEE